MTDNSTIWWVKTNTPGKLGLVQRPRGVVPADVWCSGLHDDAMAVLQDGHDVVW